MKNKAMTKEEQELARLKQIEDKRLLENYLKSGHSMPQTRREFMNAGLMGSMVLVGLPSVLQLLSQSAKAADLSSECSALLDPKGGWTPYIQVHLSGGAAIHYNTLVLDKGRQLLPSYSRLGLGEISGFSTRTEFGNVPLAVDATGNLLGPMMASLFTGAGTTAIEKTAMVKFCARSQDDSSANADSIMGLVNAAGLLGTHLPNLGSGGGRIFNPTAYVKANAIQPITNTDALTSALAVQGSLKANLTQTSHRDALLNIVQRLNGSQRKRFMASTSAQIMGKMADCSSSKNLALKDLNTADLDPRTNPDIAAAWGITTASGNNNIDVLQGMVALNTLTGKAGAAKYILGGYDYHGQTRAQQNAKDSEAGRVIGRILRTAEILGKSVFIHVTSDGSVEGNGAMTDAAFSGDSGSRGSGFILSYNPAGRPVTSDNQIGHFNSSQSVDETFMNTWTVERSALAVFANYLAIHKKMEVLEKLAPNQFGTSELDKLLKFA